MKVILKNDVRNLGSYGDEVEVADGYGRNYLIPKGLALQATDQNKSVIEQKKKIILTRLEKDKTEAESIVNQLLAEEICFKRKAGESDKIFGSVTSHDIAEFLNAKGFNIDKKKILLDDPIKSLGSFTVSIKIHPDVPCTLSVKVDKEE
jgi:large subunit ribosomal protein L9